MKGIITKVEVLDEISDYNSIGEDHSIEFEELPVLRKRFAVSEEGKGLWSTSVVTKLQVINEKSTVVTTTFSVYVLTV
jgi:hypothetical protein